MGTLNPTIPYYRQSVVIDTIHCTNDTALVANKVIIIRSSSTYTAIGRTDENIAAHEIAVARADYHKKFN